MKKVLLCLLLIGIIGTSFAQKIIEKSYNVAKDQPVLLKFDFPKVKVSSWDKDEVYIKATVNINDNKQNDKFALLDLQKDNQLLITDSIDFKHIDKVYYVEINGVKKRFESQQDYDNYREAHKDEKQSSYNTSNEMDITIEVKLPVKDYIKIQSKFGFVEVTDFTGPLDVQTEFGKIDAKLNESKVGKITLTNHFGKIYSNFDIKPSEREERNFYTSLTATPGKGPAYSLVSKFGNIYLRNAK